MGGTEVAEKQTALVVDLVGKREAYAKLAKIARKSNADELAALFGQARQLHQSAWVSMAIICGEAMQAAKRESITADDVAGLFDCHPTLIRRAAKVYDYVIQPRIEEQGDNAAFPIWQQTFYEAVCDAADYTGRPALDFVREAEDNRTVSAAEFRRRLIDEGSLPPTAAMHDEVTREARKGFGALRVLLGLDAKALKKIASMWDQDLPTMLDQAETILVTLRSQREEALQALGTKRTKDIVG